MAQKVGRREIYPPVPPPPPLEGFQSVFGSSICEMSFDSEAQFGDNLSESSSEGCCESSEASFCSASEDFQSYDYSAEPIATEEEATQLYAEQIAAQKKKSPRTCF